MKKYFGLKLIELQSKQIFEEYKWENSCGNCHRLNSLL